MTDVKQETDTIEETFEQQSIWCNECHKCATPICDLCGETDLKKCSFNVNRTLVICVDCCDYINNDSRKAKWIEEQKDTTCWFGCAGCSQKNRWNEHIYEICVYDRWTVYADPSRLLDSRCLCDE